MAASYALRMSAILVSIGLLAGCEDGVKMPSFLQGKDKGSETASADGEGSSSSSVKLVERDVEVPEAFQVTESGLWDGRPSLGGVWVAHPDVKDPERVIIRNQSNNKFVIGALFRRERENPGPRLQVSSDAATALGMLAGQPAQLNVTALRREAVPDETAAVGATKLEAPEAVETTSLDDPIATATAALDKVETQSAPAAVTQPTATPSPARSGSRASALTKPFIQIGIFSVEQNAKNTAVSLRQTGVVPIVKKQTSKGKTFWRVLVGPATNSAERATLLKKVKGIGFDDAYFVTN